MRDCSEIDADLATQTTNLSLAQAAVTEQSAVVTDAYETYTTEQSTLTSLEGTVMSIETNIGALHSEKMMHQPSPCP